MTALTAPLCLLSPCLVERWGRRPLFLLITALATLELIMITGAQALYDTLSRKFLREGGEALHDTLISELNVKNVLYDTELIR